MGCLGIGFRHEALAKTGNGATREAESEALTRGAMPRGWHPNGEHRDRIWDAAGDSGHGDTWEPPHATGRHLSAAESRWPMTAANWVGLGIVVSMPVSMWIACVSYKTLPRELRNQVIPGVLAIALSWFVVGCILALTPAL